MKLGKKNYKKLREKISTIFFNALYEEYPEFKNEQGYPDDWSDSQKKIFAVIADTENNVMKAIEEFFNYTG